MSKPVFVFFNIQGMTEAWFHLSKEEQANLWAKADEIDKSVGAKLVIMCNSRWADTANFGWGVWEYPDIDAYQKATEEYEKIEWSRYFTTNTILGTKMGT